ncbi:MAG TPA: YciC family protein [Solirubrobacterales bacterium]|nr:YciC family protein [Solirubrobacterales bacterium]
MSGSSGTAGHLDIGGVFEATGDYYKRAFGTFWIVALVLLIPSAILQVILGNGGLGGLLSFIVQIVATAWLAGAVIRIVQDIHGDGQVDYSIGELLGSVWPRLLAIIGLQILLAIIIGIGLFLLIIPGVILALILVVSLPALIVEDAGVFDSMSRSADLTKDNRMRILGVGILMILILIGIGIIAGLLSAITPVLGAIVGLVLGILLYPYISMLTAVLYFRLVELKEGGVVAVEETVIIEEDAGPPPAV